MFQRLFKPRVHESVAISAIFAASVALNLAWLANLLVHRSPMLWDAFNLLEELGPISGLYVKMLIAFFATFLISWIFWRGKDCEQFRSRVFWLFVGSIVIFLVMTLPFVYEFQVG